MSMQISGSNPVVNPESDPSSATPTSLPQQLQKNPEDLAVVTGAGGGSFVIKDTAEGIPVSQSGVQKNERGTDAVIQSLINNGIEAPLNLSNSATASTLFEGTNIGAYMTQLLSGNTNDIFKAPEETTTSTDSTTKNEDFLSLFSAGEPSAAQGGEQATTTSGSSAFPAASDANQTLGQLFSTDSGTALQTLEKFSDFTVNPQISDSQKQTISNLLTTLSQKLASATNAGTLPSGLSSFDPATVLAALKEMLSSEMSTLSPEDQAVVGQQLTQIAGNVASLNAGSGTVPSDPVLKGVQSDSKDDVFSSLEQFSGVQSDTTLTPEQKTAFLQQFDLLAAKLAAKNAGGESFGLDATDQQTVLTLFINELGGSLDSQGTLTIPGMPKEMAQAFLATLQKAAKGLSDENYQQAYQETLSTDPTVVYKGLQSISGVANSKAPPGEIQAASDYLKVLAVALAMMAQIRTKIAVDDAKYTKLESAGKLANIQDQTRLALANFKTNGDKITTQIEKAVAQIKQKWLMKILMPFLMIFMAIVMITIIIATGGGATPLVVGMVAGVVASTGMGMAESVGQVFTKAIAHALGINLDNPSAEDMAKISGLSAALQVIIMLFLMISSMGVAGATAGVSMAMSEAGQAGMQAADLSMLDMAAIGASATIKTGVTDSVSSGANAAMTIGLIASPILSSGVIFQGISAAIKATHPNMSDDDVAKIAMMINMMIMILSMLLMGAAALGKGGMDKIIQRVANVFKQTQEEQGTGAALDAAGGVGTSLEDVAGGAMANTDHAITEASKLNRMINDLLKRMEEMFKNPSTAILHIMTGAAAAAQAGAAVAQGQSEMLQAGLTENEMEYTKQIFQSQAMIDFLKSLVPSMDTTIQNMQQDTNEMMEFVQKIFTMFEQYVQSASSITTKLHQGS